MTVPNPLPTGNHLSHMLHSKNNFNMLLLSGQYIPSFIIMFVVSVVDVVPTYIGH